MDRHEQLAALIRSARSVRSARLVAGGASRAWPGGPADRVQPGALDWVRRWRPRHPITAADLPVCRCADGPCAICN